MIKGEVRLPGLLRDVYKYLHVRLGDGGDAAERPAELGYGEVVVDRGVEVEADVGAGEVR